MRLLLSLGIALAALTGALLLTRASEAGTPTPTPNTSVPPTETATPYPQSTITVQFVRDGEPAPFTLGESQENHC